MQKIKRLILIIMCLMLSFSTFACSDGSDRTPPPKEFLQDYYREYFPIGAAINAARLEANLPVLKHFNSYTAEAQMKWLTVQPTENNFVWQNSTLDVTTKIVNSAKAEGKLIRGHALCWYKSLPSWVLSPGTTKETALARLRSHIDTTVKHFGADVYCWDVVNEAISNAPTQAQVDSGNFYRTGSEATGDNKGDWYAFCGKDYIKEAFIAAKQAVDEIGADIKLYYNDYGLNSPAKRNAVVKLINELRAEGVTVDGIGMQAHYKLATFKLDEFEKSIETFTDMGLDVQLTELDISVYNSSEEPEHPSLPIEIEELQAKMYADIFEVMRRYSYQREGKGRACGITFWGLTDNASWLNSFPVKRKDYPLLFDAHQNPKLGYYAVIDF